MKAQKVELVALAIAEMNSAFTPGSEAFIYRNPGKLRETNGNLRSFSTWAGGLKSLISELSRFDGETRVLAVLGKYGCNSIEKEMLTLDYITQALGQMIEPSATLSIVDAV